MPPPGYIVKSHCSTLVRIVFIGAGLTCQAHLLLSQAALRLSAGAVLLPSDKAALFSRDDRHDLDCKVDRVKPQMELDLLFHTGYVARVPLKEIAGPGAKLSILTRVVPLAAAGKETVFSDTVSVPAINPRSGGEAELPGEYVVGPGKYQVDWLLRDGAGRMCSSHWKIEAKLHHEFENVPLSIPADTAREKPADPFQDAAPITRAGYHPLYAKVLVNFSPGMGAEPVLDDRNVRAILSILRGVAREPRFGRFSVVGFSMDEQRVFYRQNPAPHIDFPAIGTAASGLHPGTVDVRQIADPDSATDFLGKLLVGEFQPQDPFPDAVVVISPKVMLDGKVPTRLLASNGHPRCPIFYLNYNSDPRGNPWRGALGSALKVYRALEYSITRPRDLGSALHDMVSKLNSGK